MKARSGDVYGREQKFERRGDEKREIQQQKESRRNCCNSPAARRVPKNADSICKQFNAKALGTQEKFHV